MDDREQQRTEELQSHSGPQSLPTLDLLKNISEDARNLLHLEIELAKSEAKQDFDSEIDLAKGATIAAVCGLLGLNMLIVAAVFAMAPRYAWIAALGTGLVLLVISWTAAYVGWQRAQKYPMGHTRQSLKEDVEWAKNQMQ